MHNKFSFKYLILIILFVMALLLSLTVYSIKSGRKLTFIESAIKDSTLFVGKVLYTPFGFVKDKVDDLTSLINIKKKYDDLKKESSMIDSYKAEIDSLKEEINDLKKLTDIDDVLSLYSTINATVVNRDYNYWNNKLTIDKGSTSGIEVGQAVTSDGKLIGVISNVSNFSADVRLLSSDKLDNNISVALEVDGNTLYGLLTRYNLKENVYIVEGISYSGDIKVGTLIKTSGLTNSFPRGIIIGEVSFLDKDSFDLTSVLKVKPLADFNDIKYVNVLVGDLK